jgi:hypothetical protein
VTEIANDRSTPFFVLFGFFLGQRGHCTTNSFLYHLDARNSFHHWSFRSYTFVDWDPYVFGCSFFFFLCASLTMLFYFAFHPRCHRRTSAAPIEVIAAPPFDEKCTLSTGTSPCQTLGPNELTRSPDSVKNPLWLDGGKHVEVINVELNGGGLSHGNKI